MSSRSSSPSRSSCSSEEEEEAGAAECRSPVGLEGCSCCLALADRGLGAEEGRQGDGNGNGSPPRASPGSPFLQLREQLFCRRNLNAAKLSRMLARGGSLEPVVRDPCYLRNQGVCNRNIDQTLLSILLFFHSASGASVVAIDNKIEQAMDLVKNHLMYAVREEVEILKEQIKELAEKNSQLERENSLLKNLASPEQLQKFQSCLPLEVQLPSPPPPPSLASPSPAAERQSAPGGPAAVAAEAVRAQHRAGSAV